MHNNYLWEINTFEVSVWNGSVHILNSEFIFTYIPSQSNESYTGGLQCNYNYDSKEYKELEMKLCELAKIYLTL